MAALKPKRNKGDYAKVRKTLTCEGGSTSQKIVIESAILNEISRLILNDFEWIQFEFAKRWITPDRDLTISDKKKEIDLLLRIKTKVFGKNSLEEDAFLHSLDEGLDPRLARILGTLYRRLTSVIESKKQFLSQEVKISGQKDKSVSLEKMLLIQKSIIESICPDCNEQASDLALSLLFEMFNGKPIKYDALRMKITRYRNSLKKAPSEEKEVLRIIDSYQKYFSKRL